MKITLATRIFLGYAIVTLTFGAVSIYSVLELRLIGSEIRLVSDGYLALAKSTAQLESFHKSRQRDTERLFAENSPETRQALLRLAQGYFPQRVKGRLSGIAEIAERAARTAPHTERKFLLNLVARFDELSRLYADYEEAGQELFRQLSQDGVLDRNSEGARALLAQERKLEREIQVLALMLDQRVAERVRIAEQREQKSAWLIVALSIFAIALGLIATLIAGRLLAPIQSLTKAVRKIGAGERGVAIPLDAQNEIGVLARALDTMVRTRDERERELAEKQEALVRAERLAAIGRISAQITHEIRNPLTSIGLNTELLQEELEEGGSREEAQKLLASIAREVDRLAEISEQYLSFARFPKPVFSVIDTAEFLRELIDFHGAELARAGVRIERKIAPGCASIVGDEGQLRQALLNLMRNSREALVHGGTLCIEARALVTQVEISVCDDGPGIAPDALERMFDPFFSTKERGTGLGLALTQQIIAEHCGELSCQSEIGKGTRFTIRLRRASESELARSVEPAAS